MYMCVVFYFPLPSLYIHAYTFVFAFRYKYIENVCLRLSPTTDAGVFTSL